ncbi:phosphoribosyl 1,2-cyclic phosphate phosphodiesterase [Marinitoga hydrogenitolerans DSM 16785]|uniref:Phosphoribosyl 1,2-cyclic phosphate phosphodiesterase n=1 Tax=Marinitoga hydrogenitolerans (strain DSM 16785 / JCM 12826 / AT1271) TaxID=1122195 RepID=A0A1M4S4P9_MARH1|nr:MBL fold metallo-hydrolase [Marinitoga hydrogenitolerans]SHE27186.1 phosphoribosyl 1,2-cyclic phosphate phosphodiesterase [Marinitoga hydrogenitolerans DSM 16785]
MELLFLGTAASEGFPNPFCSCENCQKAREEGKKSIRLRSSLLIDNEILIDFGPDILSSVNRFGMELSDIKHILITHGHSDHLFFKNFEYRNPIFSGTFDLLPHIDLIVPDRLGAVIKEKVDLPKISLMSVTPFVSLHLNGYIVYTLKAKHTPGYDETPLNYIVEKDGVKMLYGVDSGKFLAESIEYIKNEIKYLDIVILDATMGFNKKYEFHMGYEEVLETKEILQKEGIIDDKSKIVVTHFSHLHNPEHTELEKIYDKHNIIAAFDGLKIKK